MTLPLIVRLSRWRAGSRYAMAMLMRTPSMVLRALGETPVDSGWFWSGSSRKSASTQAR